VLEITRDPEVFYILALSDDNKKRIKILDATLFITQVQWKPLFLLLTPMFWD